MARIGHQGGGVGEEAVDELHRHEHRVQCDGDDEGAALVLGIAMVVSVVMAMSVACVVARGGRSGRGATAVVVIAAVMAVTMPMVMVVVVRVCHGGWVDRGLRTVWPLQPQAGRWINSIL